MTPEQQELLRDLTTVRQMDYGRIREDARKMMEEIERMVLGDGSDVRSLEQQRREESGPGTQERR